MPADLLFRTDAYAQTATATVTHAAPEGLRLDRTVFYPLGGGQPGDTGLVRWPGGEAAIADTRKYRAEGEPEDVLHLLPDGAALPAPGAPVELVLDWPRRYAHMRMHTAMHLVSAILRGAAVTGGQVGAEKSRLDFDLPASPDKDELTASLNALIAADHPVTDRWITDDELAAQPELVRTMSVKPPTGHGRVRLLAIGDNAAIDLQPCGGTHIRRTGEIGPVVITKIENKGKQNRRIWLAFRQGQSI